MSVSRTNDALIVVLDFEGESNTSSQSAWYSLRNKQQASTVSRVRIRKTCFFFSSILRFLILWEKRVTLWSSPLNWCFVEVLFHNDFVLSRDIGLLQSFQSSSYMLDPASNPTLFQSTLVIVVKVGEWHTGLYNNTSCLFSGCIRLRQGWSDEGVSFFTIPDLTSVNNI